MSSSVSPSPWQFLLLWNYLARVLGGWAEPAHGGRAGARVTSPKAQGCRGGSLHCPSDKGAAGRSLCDKNTKGHWSGRVVSGWVFLSVSSYHIQPYTTPEMTGLYYCFLLFYTYSFTTGRLRGRCLTFQWIPLFHILNQNERPDVLTGSCRRAPSSPKDLNKRGSCWFSTDLLLGQPGL